MITLIGKETSMFWISFSAFCICTFSFQAEAAVHVADVSYSDEIYSGPVGNQGDIELLPDEMVFAAVASDTESTSVDKKTTYQINSLQWEQTPEDFILRVYGDTPPTYTMYELFDPLRVIIDIADASMGATVNLPLEQPQGPVSLVNGTVLEDKEPFIARLEIFLNEDNSYVVERVDNDILIRFPKTVAEPQTVAAAPQPPEETPSPDPETEVFVQEQPQETAEISTETETVVETTEPEAMPAMEAVSEPVAQVQQSVAQLQPATVLFDVEVDHTPTETSIYLRADGAISDYKEVKLGKNLKANKPDRIYLDVNDVKLAGPIETKDIGTVVARVRTAQRKTGFRIVFDSSLDRLFDYNLSVQTDGLLITVQEPSATTALIAEIMQENDQSPEPEMAPQPEIIAPAETMDMVAQAAEPLQPQLMSEKTDTASQQQKVSKKKTERSGAVQDLTFSGYEKQRVTVDFYKIDLHNVFRLFGEISNLNMVVAEGVGGNLTLSLNDVPWDFALDIILNLKDLQKEERFNTIVISPKSQKFTWPERTLDTIDFKADIEVIEQQQGEIEAIKISKRQEVPETVVEAKKLIHQAQMKEKMGLYDEALPIYEEALKKWPDNVILAKRIAGLCLVKLSHNAKAVTYAKTALLINPKDSDAALQAAIGLARMKKNQQADDYFKIAISGGRPSSEALASYSGFCEEKQDYECALAMLQKHDDLHGDTLNTMISRARILDKQGRMSEAVEEYRALLLSGYEIPPDLARFIKARVSLAAN